MHGAFYQEQRPLRPTTLGGHQWCTAEVKTAPYIQEMESIHRCRIKQGTVRTRSGSEVEATEENMEILLDENVSTEKDVKELGIQW